MRGNFFSPRNAYWMKYMNDSCSGEYPTWNT